MNPTHLIPTDCLGGLTPQRGYVQAGATRLSYLTWGARGSPLVLLHGITSSARTWWRVAPQLVARGYRVYGFDMPGHGESAETDTHAIANIAALIERACALLELDRPTIIGHSWGGATALALAGSLAAARVVLIDPLLGQTSASAAALLNSFLDGVGQPREQTLPRIRATNPDWHTCDVFWKAEALEQCRATAVRGVFIDSGDWDLTGRFADVSAPLLLMIADPQHTIIPAALLAAAQAAMRPGLVESVVVHGTTHNMMRGSGFEPSMQVLLAWLQHDRIDQ